MNHHIKVDLTLTVTTNELELTLPLIRVKLSPKPWEGDHTLQMENICWENQRVAKPL